MGSGLDSAPSAAVEADAGHAAGHAATGQPPSGALSAGSFGAGLDQHALRLRLIGPVSAWSLTPASLLPPGRKTRALLAILAMALPRPVARVRLAEMLWSNRPEEQARASLRQELHRLHDALAPAGVELLLASRDQVGLKPGLVWVDTAELMDANVERPAALVLLDRELMEDMDNVDPVFDVWLAEQRDKLRLRARDLAEALLADVNDTDMAMLAAQRLLTIDSAHEGAWRAMIRGYAARGEHGMASQAFERCKAVLAERLGAQPSPETMQVVSQIRGMQNGGDTRTLPAREAQPYRQTSSSPAIRVGVSPPQVLGEAAQMLPVAIGLAEEVTVALSRFQWFTTVSSAAVQRLVRAGEDQESLRRSLALDFLVDGNLQRSGNQLRLSMRLVDLTAREQVIWADKFDGNANDALNMQEAVAAQIAARVDTALLHNASHGVAGMPFLDHLRALPLMLGLDRTEFETAGRILAAAATDECNRADVFYWYALWHMLALAQSWQPAAPEQSIDRALTLAKRASRLDPRDARAVMYHGMVCAEAMGTPREGLVLYERAMQMNPCLSLTWLLAARACIAMGDPDRAARFLAEGVRLVPLYPIGFLLDETRMRLALLHRDYATTISFGRQLIELYPHYLPPYLTFAAALGYGGDGTEIAKIRSRLEQMLPVAPGPVIIRWLARAAGDYRQILTEGLRRAGLL